MMLLAPILILIIITGAVPNSFATHGVEDAWNNHLYDWADAPSSSSYGQPPLLRLKREAVIDSKKGSPADDSANDDPPMGPIRIPSDYDDEDDNKSTEHTYYNRTVISMNREELIASKYYVDMEKWLNETGVQGSPKHEHLKGSYRKAAGVRFRFKFPFYGHRLNNVTIATGGFCYVGEHTHSWLAATQYIAPLMANFDSHSPNASIMHGDDGEKMIIEWSRVSLRDNKPAGEFTFQAHLFKSGDIWFIYKDIPMPIQNISDMQHPCKLGISDAYLFNHKISPTEKASFLHPTSRRVIHEYHRIAVDAEDVKSGTVVVLTALPTCLNYTTCHECTNAQLKHFQCSWCTPKGGANTANGGDSVESTKATPFCSDQIGLNRRRQEWAEGDCAVEKRNQYCDIAPHSAGPNSSSTESPPTTKGSSSWQETTTAGRSGEAKQAQPSPSIEIRTQDKQTKARQGQKEEEKGGGGGAAFLTVLVMMAIGCVAWVLYAFYNPHTPSGQLLIKYRPSKWQIPSSHVRYSANVHI